jgi:MoxR-like ATPase
MKFPFYLGQSQRRNLAANTPAKLPGPLQEFWKPENYLPEPGLVDAVNVSLLLRQPLLLTGEPGTGKTQLAYSVARELGFGDPLKFETKSNSVARDLFYSYDALGRFQKSAGENADPFVYLTYNALGRSIILANDPKTVKSFLPAGYKHPGNTQSVVLIDEVDKAPRDFPNDILNEIDGMYFRIVEMGNVMLSAPAELRPVVILTSNSEKGLPDPFLRRCVYYNISFPDRNRLLDIVSARCGSFISSDSVDLRSCVDLFYGLRDPSLGLRKKPATGELLNWVAAMARIRSEIPGIMRDEAILRTLTVLVKTAEDQERALTRTRQWLSEHR